MFRIYGLFVIIMVSINVYTIKSNIGLDMINPLIIYLILTINDTYW